MLAVSVENLAKLYRLGTIGAGTLRDDIELLTGWFRRVASSGESRKQEDFQALAGVSFDVREGEILGIIGSNGAGKSTLLKILSRVTAPTSGRVRLKGRVASLLEVGTGFHPELTGRENIFLSGAILGMTKAEVKANLDEIVSFSGVETFIDTPVKRYSSGMYVRLAFAVAAHLQSDILIVDEVLAVGDAAFQRKCLGSMHTAAKSGRTVLFVSHNLGAVTSLCERCLLLDSGRVSLDGTPKDVVAKYLGNSGATPAEIRLPSVESAEKSDVSLRHVFLRNVAGDTTAVFFQGDPVEISVGYTLHRDFADFSVGIQILASDGTLIAHCTDDHARPAGAKAAGEYEAKFSIVAGGLSYGSYWVSVLSAEPMVRIHFTLPSALSFRVESTSAEASRYGLESRPGFLGPALFAWSQTHEPRA